MKYTTNKKKNSKNGHGWVKQPEFPDGVNIAELESRLVRIVPDGYMAVCHICNPPRPLTKQENENHDREVHNIKR